jgi:hypothetical protein
MKHRVPIAIFSLMIFMGILVTFLGVLLQGAKSFPFFAVFGIGVAVFMVGFFFLLYYVVFVVLDRSSRIFRRGRL